RTRLPFCERDGFFNVCLVEVNGRCGLGRVEDSANRELDIDGINRSVDVDAVAQLPAEFLGELIVNHATGAVALPGLELVGGNPDVGEYLEDFVRIGAELREKMFGLVVNVQSAEPVVRSDGDHSGDGANLLAV